MSRNVIIDQDDLNEIMGYFAFPVLDFSVFPYTEEQIKDLFIWPALRDYFRFWPKLNVIEYVIDTNFEIDFPNINTFTSLSAILNSNTPTSGSMTGEPFVDASSVLSVNNRYSGRYGTRYNYNQHIAYHMKRAEYQGLKNSQNAWKFFIDKVNRKIKGYTNISSRMTVTWAEFSSDFNEIPFDKIQDVIELSVANIFNGWGNMLSMQSTELSNELDGTFMLDQSSELKTKVLNRWKAITKAIVMKSS